MRKSIQVIINLLIPIFIFVASLSLVAIGNIAAVFKPLLKDLGADTPYQPMFNVINLIKD